MRYPAALALVVLIGGAGWLVGRNRPVPGWITERLIPALGWLVIVLAAVALIQRIRGKP
jgi:hypothetical protein